VTPRPLAIINSLFVGLVALLLASSPAVAQEFRATVSGTIRDASGSPIPGATVTVIETRTGTKSDTVSDATGQFVVPFLAPGDYEIHAVLQGFKEYSRKGIHLASGDHLVIDCCRGYTTGVASCSGSSRSNA